MTETLRVVQWATGNIGTRSLRGVIDHPDLELVGLYVYSDAKAGRDAGELCDRAPVGVVATRSIEDIVALRADCVLYMGDRFDVDVLCRLLESGANVIATRSEVHRPASIDPEVRAHLEAACARGGSTLHGTGVSPGFITEALPIVLTSIQRRLDRLVIDEFADLSSRPSPDLLFDLMGYGRDPATFGPERWTHGGASFGPSLAALADALGLTLDSIETGGEVAVATRTIEIAAGTIPAGTVAAQRMIITGMRGGRPLLQMRPTWYCSADIDPAWPLQASGWHVLLEGDAPLDVTISFPVAPEDYAEMTPGLTANRPVNAIPYVCAAAPGIRTTAELPQVIANLGS
jgi:4-hydroxy-tetrahydrodipicolinate reductase